MPNPFKQQGAGFRQSTDWLAAGVGLLGKLAAQEAKGGGTNLALVGAVGSGKTTALAEYKRRLVTGETVLLDYLLDRISVQNALDLHNLVYSDLVRELGSALLDEAATKEGLRKPGPPGPPRRDEVFKLIGGMISIAKNRRGIHVLVDECQRPAEAFEREKDPGKLTDWFEELKAVGETVNQAGGRMVITITPSPWENGPEHLKGRFVELAAQAPTAAEIQAFIREGLKHAGGDPPIKVKNDMGQWIFDMTSIDNGPLTIRALHAMLHVAWEKANAKGAKILSSTHLG